MAGYFKKRRTRQGPNKNEQKVLRAKSEELRAKSGGVVGARFPAVKQLRVQLEFLDARQQVLDEKTLDLGPSDATAFMAPCPGRCGRGSFDFSSRIAEAVDRRLPAAELSEACREPLFAGSPEACGCQARCRVEIEYRPSAAGG